MHMHADGPQRPEEEAGVGVAVRWTGHWEWTSSSL